MRALIDSVHVEGWCVALVDGLIHIERAAPPIDNRTGGKLASFGCTMSVPDGWTREQIIRRLFANLQYLTDHELREQFMVGGARPFEPHVPSVTGEQKDWFVERESAVRGY